MAQQNQGPQAPPVTTLGAFGPADIQAFTEAVEKLRQSANVVGSVAVTTLPSMHKIATELVYLDPDPKNGKDVYEIYQQGLALSAGAILRIANAAGVEFIVSRRSDDGADPDVIQWRAIARYVGLDGVSREHEANYGLDFKARWDDAEARAWLGKDAVKTDEQAREKADKAIRQMRLHGVQRAETSAKARAASQALGLKRGGWTARDLGRPFLVTKIVPDIDYQNDPMARAMLIARHSGLAALAFGAGQRLGVLDALAPHVPAQLAPAREEPETSGPARTSAPPASEPARGPEGMTRSERAADPPPREGAARDALRRPAPPADDERDPWDNPGPAQGARRPDPEPSWPTLEEFLRLGFPSEQADMLAAALDAIGQKDAAERVRKAAVDPDTFGEWYGRALAKLQGGKGGSR